MSTTISITVQNEAAVKAIVAFLTKFGQVKTVAHGAPEALVYQPDQAVRDNNDRITEVKSSIYKVNRALVDLPASDFLGPWDFITTVEKEEILSWLSKKKADALKRTLQEIDMFHQVRSERKAELDREGATGLIDVPRVPPAPKECWVDDLGTVGELMGTVKASFLAVSRPRMTTLIEAEVEITQDETVPDQEGESHEDVGSRGMNSILEDSAFDNSDQAEEQDVPRIIGAGRSITQEELDNDPELSNWVNDAKRAADVMAWEDQGAARADTPTVLSQLMSQREAPVKSRETIQQEVDAFITQARKDQEKAELEAHKAAMEEAKRAYSFARYGRYGDGP